MQAFMLHCGTALALALTLGAAAQQPAAAKAPPDDPLQPLYEEARAAIAALPDTAAPNDWLALASQERLRHPDWARDDAARAFRLALALPAAKEDSTGVERWRFATKANIELEATTVLTGLPGGFEVAHDLARAADVPRYRLYTELIGTAESAAVKKAGRQFPVAQGVLAYMNGGVGYTYHPYKSPSGVDPGYDVLALANECKQLDGTFPFLGVLIALDTYHRDGFDQRPLLLASYQAAASASQAIEMNAASGVLTKGHELYPDLDPQLESAAESMLRNLRDMVQHPPASAGSAARDRYNAGLVQAEQRAGGAILTLLDKVDANRAAEVKAEYSIFANPSRPRSFRISDLTKQQRTDNDSPEAALTRINGMPTLSDQQKAAKFRATMNLAITLAEKNPKPASAAADEALDLLTPALFESNYERLALLAARMANDLHENLQAENLIRRCLDLAEQKAVAVDQEFDAASPDDQPKHVNDFEGAGASQVETFTFAAMVDPELARSRAEQTSAIYFKPMFLLRVALGQEMQHPWWE